MDGDRPFPAKRGVNIRFLGLTGFRCVTERQKYGLVSNGLTSCVTVAHAQQPTHLSLV